MRPLGPLPKPTSIALFALLLAFSAMTVSAQTEISYDWQTRSMTSCPAEINQRKKGRIVINNLNTILYQYDVNVVTTEAELDDFGNLKEHIMRAGRAAGQGDSGDSTESGRESPCDPLLAEAEPILRRMNDALENDPALPPGYKKAKRTDSISLRASLDAWRNLEDEFSALKEKADEIRKKGCRGAAVTTFLASYSDIEAAMNRLRRRVNSSHSVSLDREIRPNTKYDVTVKESFEGTVTGTGNVTFTCEPSSGQLTLTAGALFSRVPDRGYEARKVPGMEETQLVVEGGSDFRPEGVLLLNYLLPRLDNGTVGLALSAGPAIRFGSKSDIATLGFFTGVSANLYRRFYITPGLHFGEFADFPAGFREGQAVPANFGQLTPVKRWTTRFALALSFRARNFDGVSGSSAAPGGGEKKEEKVKNEKPGRDAGRGGASELAGGRRAAADTAGFVPTNYSAATTAADYPSFIRTVSLKRAETLNGSLITLTSDSALTDYTTFTTGNTLYIVLPHTQALAQKGDAGGAVFEQSGNNLVVSFVVPRGATARVTQKFNRLQVSLSSGASVLAEASR